MSSRILKEGLIAGADLFQDKHQAAKEGEAEDYWGWEALLEWEDAGIG